MIANTRIRVQHSARRAGGLRAKRAGGEFEKLILASRCYGVTLHRIENFAKRIGGGKMVEIKSPYDFAGVISGTGIFFDAKTVQDGTGFRVHDQKIVKLHQLDALRSLQINGAIAGFMVRCGRMRDYRFLPALEAMSLAQRGESAKWNNPAWFILGPIGEPVPLQRLLRWLRYAPNL